MADQIIPKELQPEELRKAAEEIAAVCRKYKLARMSAELVPEWHVNLMGTHASVKMDWTQGRHGEERGSANLTFTRTMRIPVEAPEGEDLGYKR